MNSLNISIVDDHTMISSAISNMVDENPKYTVQNTFANGEEFINYLAQDNSQPDIVLMDINMPRKNGIVTTSYLTDKYPDIKVIALTMEDDEKVIIQMMKAGAKGYLLKDMHPDILFEALETVYEKGIFYTDIITQTLFKLNKEDKTKEEIQDRLKERELEFIQHACSEDTYKEIAEKMFLSPKTVDNYRDAVFVKLNVKSRVGLVLYAIKHGLYEEADNDSDTK